MTRIDEIEGIGAVYSKKLEAAGIESVVKASLVKACAVADVIDADRPIAALPDQL